MKPTAVGLFAGAGGLDLGFRNAGIKTVAAFDISPAAVASYNHNSRRSVASVLDLAAAKPERVVEEVRHRTAKSPIPTIVLGGPPCQGFSRGNASADPKDPRNLLPYRYINAIEALNLRSQIDAFVFENVPALRAPKHAARYRRIQKKLVAAGFDIFDGQINSIRFGVPQERERLFIVGFNQKLGVANFKIPQGDMRYDESPKTVFHAIGHLPDPIFRSNDIVANEIPFHANHWTSPPVSPKFKLRQFNNGRSFRKLEWDQPSKTVAYGNREIHVHPNGKRRLSILEAMLLQGFPQTFVLRGTFSQQVEQVSNAVPPPVARAIAKAVAKVLVQIKG